MDIQKNEALIAEIEQFKKEALKMHIVQVLADSYTNTNLFDYNLDSDGSVIWYKAQARQLWDFWKAAKVKALPNLQNEITSKPIRVSQKTLCFLLDIRSETLRQTIKKDPDFPKPIKKGSHEQGAVHYDYQEILNWHESKKSEAYKKAQEDAELNAIADSRKDQKRISVNIEDL